MSNIDRDSSQTETGDALLQQSNLTTSQFYIWMGQRLSPGLPLYNMALSFEIQDQLNVGRFRRAFSELVAGCDALRTTITEEDGVPRQTVFPPQAFELELLDFSDEEDPSAAAREWCGERSRRILPLDERLFDAALLKVDAARYIWYLNQHHLITDAWSTAVVYERMARIYGRLGDDACEEQAQWPLYADYVDYERSRRESNAAQAARKHWTKKGQEEIDALRFYGQPGPRGSARTERRNCVLGLERSERLRQLADAPEFRAITKDSSLFGLVCTLLFAWLHRVSGSNALSVLSPSHNRSKPAFREMSGLFIEIFPLHMQVDPGETFANLAEKARAEAMDFLQYAIAGSSSNEANRDNTVLLNFINRSFGSFNGAPMNSEWIHPGHGDATHSLRVQVHDFDESGEIKLLFDFHCDVFGERERQWAIDHFIKMVDACLDDPAQEIGRVSLLSQDDQRRIEAYNASGAAAPPKGSVISRFRKQAAKNPAACAAEWGGSSLTYAALNARSNQLARLLARRGGTGNTLVAILMERSADLLTAMLGVLKAGAAYVPLDPQHPPARIKKILEAGNIGTVLASSHLGKRLGKGHWDLLCLDEMDQALSQEDDADTPHEPCPEDLAYVIYTSGSTGDPKGVMISHGAFTNYVVWAAENYTKGESCTFALFTSPAFDLTVTSVYVPLITGGRILIYGNSERAGDLSVLDVIEDDQADVIKLTPSHLALLLNVDISGGAVKRMILGGEDLKSALAEAATAKFGSSLEIYNEYGPTEATVGCMIHQYVSGENAAGSVSIGVPAADTQIYLLDEYHQPTPPGVVGELYIAGAGLAEGYLNSPALTEEAFVPNPFTPGTRMYKTGDLGRWRPDGELEFLGRKDEQVKVRGARVELGEIEAALLEYESVTECVVAVVESQPAADAFSGLSYCVKCGLPSNVMGADIREDGRCNVCHEYEAYKDQADNYFRTMDELRALFNGGAPGEGKYDCIMLLSGGKDSTYALGRLKEMGLRVLALFLDNGYISDEAKTNIERVVQALDVDLTCVSTPAMDAVFVDSLQRHSNVCNGCFKVIYTLAIECAHRHGIRYVVTGLSRGQIFDTRLKDFYRHGIFDPGKIDKRIIQARKAYHRAKDAVSCHMDVSLMQDDAIFNDIEFVDFYRYCDVELDEMRSFLAEKVPWVRPSDTGRSTNCLINEAGIFIHKRDRGFHNYASPYSWDVRLGHKNRDDAMEELEDDIDEANVRKILDEIGYNDDEAARAPEQRLTAYYVAAAETPPAQLRAHLNERLPGYMAPQAYVQLERLPLTINGKVDRKALPAPGAGERDVAAAYVAPRNATESILAEIWQSIIGLERVGIEDDFFELGGDSILNIQIIARANEAGLNLTPRQLFEHPTIAELARAASASAPKAPEALPVTGELPLSPIQHWFFECGMKSLDGWIQEMHFEVTPGLAADILAKALKFVTAHHPALSLAFRQSPKGWRQIAGESEEYNILSVHNLAELDPPTQKERLAETAAQLRDGIRIDTGKVIRAAFADLGGGRPPCLIMVAHHLVIDALSWSTLMADLERVCGQLEEGRPEELPANHASLRDWADQLSALASDSSASKHARFFSQQVAQGSAEIPTDCLEATPDLEGREQVLTVRIEQADSDALMGEANRAYGTRAAEFLYAALGMALCDWTGQDGVIIDTESYGRETATDERDWSRTIGCFTSLFPMLLNKADPGDPAAPLVAAKDRLRNMPKGGAAFGVLGYLSEDGGLRDALAKLPRPNLVFNYLGRWDRLLAESPHFTPLGPLSRRYGAGNERPHHVAVNAMVSDGALRIDWEFNPEFHRPDSIETLAESFLDHLRGLLEYCMSKDETTRTVSDFPMANLNEAQLKKLSEKLGGPTP